MNIIFTNVNQYSQVHEAFRLDMLNERAKKYGWQIFARNIDGKKYPYYSNVTYSDKVNIKNDFKEFCKKWKPKKICNYIDYLTLWDAVEYDCEHIYFVRSCYAEVLSQSIQPIKQKWIENERRWIKKADRVIVTCPESQKVVKKHYNIDSDIVLEYVNPEKFHKVDIPSFKKKAYYVGRFDIQKRFYLIQPKPNWDIIGIGKNELDDDRYLSMETHELMRFEKYIKYINDAIFGLYPAVWESNGFGVQECLSMGKIPIIQKNSGGHERLCNTSNSITIDWLEDNWNEKALDLWKPNMHTNAKDTLTTEMYQNSLEKFVEVMHS